MRCPSCFDRNEKDTRTDDTVTDPLPWPPSAAAATSAHEEHAGNASPFDGIDLTASPPRNARSVVVPSASPRKSPPKKAPPTKQGTLYRFFSEKRNRGRPKKGSKPKPQHVVLYSSKKEEKKAKAAAAKAAAAAEAVADVDMSEVAARNNSGKKKPSADAPRQPKPKKSRVGYAEGEEYDRLSKAIYDWDNDTGDKLDPNGEPLSMRAFCIEVGIPKKTFEKYVCADVSKRRKLGRRAGRPALLSKESKDIIEDSLARADRANDGYSRKEAIDTVVNSLVSLPRHLHVLVLLYLASTCS